MIVNAMRILRAARLSRSLDRAHQRSTRWAMMPATLPISRYDASVSVRPRRRSHTTANTENSSARRAGWDMSTAATSCSKTSTRVSSMRRPVAVAGLMIASRNCCSFIGSSVSARFSRAAASTGYREISGRQAVSTAKTTVVGGSASGATSAASSARNCCRSASFAPSANSCSPWSMISRRGPRSARVTAEFNAATGSAPGVRVIALRGCSAGRRPAASSEVLPTPWGPSSISNLGEPLVSISESSCSSCCVACFRPKNRSPSSNR